MSPADAVAVARAVMAVPIAWAILSDARPLAFAIFAVAAASDVVDGWLARRSGALGAWGAFLDPLADKILVAGVLGALAVVGAIAWPLVALLAAREAAVVAGRAITYARGVRLSAGRVAKLKTFCEMVGIGALIVAPPALRGAGATLVATALVIGVLTLPHYLPRPRAHLT